MNKIRRLILTSVILAFAPLVYGGQSNLGEVVTKIIPGSNVTVSPSGGTGEVTVNASSGSTHLPLPASDTGYINTSPSADQTHLGSLNVGTNFGIGNTNLPADYPFQIKKLTSEVDLNRTLFQAHMTDLTANQDVTWKFGKEQAVGNELDQTFKWVADQDSTQPNSYMLRYNGHSSPFLIGNTNEYVGINTLTPLARFHVRNGSVSVTGTSAAVYVGGSILARLTDTWPYFSTGTVFSVINSSLSISSLTLLNPFGLSDISAPHISTGYSNAQNFMNYVLSPGLSDGGAISTASLTSINVAAGSGTIKAVDANSPNVNVQFITWRSSNAIPIPSTAVRYIGIQYNNGVPSVTVRTTENWDLDTEFALGTVITDGTSIYFKPTPWRTNDSVANMIERFDSISFVSRDNRIGGLALGTSGTRNITVSAGSLLARLEEFALSAIDTSIPGQYFDAYYRNGSGGWNKLTGQTQFNNSQYDNNSGTLQSITLLDYVSNWLYLMTDGTLAMVYGQADNGTLAALLQGDNAPSSVPSRISEMGILIGRIIAQQGTNTPTQVQSAFNTQFAGTVVSNHNNLAGLQGGTANEYYHLTNNKYLELSTATAYILQGNATSYVTINGSTQTKSGGLNVVGDVGVGTLSPSGFNRQVHIAGGDNTALILERLTTPTRKWAWVTGGGSDITTGAGALIAQDMTSGQNVFWIEAGAPSNAFYLDGTGNLGLGTSVPTAKMHVIGDVAATSASFTTTGNAPGNVGLRVSSSAYIATSGGLVGIGTTNPAHTVLAKFAVFNNVAGAPVRILAENGDNTNGTSNAVLEARVAGSSGGDPYVDLDVSGTGGWSMGLDNSDSQKLKWDWGAPPSVGGATKMTIDTSGNVGIGTSGPADIFHILKSNQNAIDELILENGGAHTIGDAGGFGILFRDKNQTPASKDYSEMDFTVNNNGVGGETGSINFNVMNSGTSAERMRILGNKVGIGTNAPTSKLDIFGGSITIRGTNVGLNILGTAATYGSGSLLDVQGGSLTIRGPSACIRIGSGTVAGPPPTEGFFTVLYASQTNVNLELFVKDSAGNNTRLSSHNPKTGEFQIDSSKQKDGDGPIERTVHIDVERAFKDLEKITGIPYVIESNPLPVPFANEPIIKPQIISFADQKQSLLTQQAVIDGQAKIIENLKQRIELLEAKPKP